jgi:soluble lytic murein transglycosylase-like protein
MLNRATRATFEFTRKKASQSATWAVFVRDTVSGFLTTAHHALMVLGIIAIGTLGILFVKPDLADQLKALSPFANADADETIIAPYEVGTLMQPASSKIQASMTAPQQTGPLKDADIKMIGTSRQQQWVTNWLSRRYRVASDATNMLVSAAYMTAKEIKLDPLLILSVMAIESGFNPFAESPVGAQGLMQVMSKVHHDKFQDLGGVKAALNPVANIKVGSLILKDYVTRGGSVEAGLKLYVGAGAFETDSGYGAKVLAEYHRLKEVAMGKKVSIYTTSASAAPVKHSADTKSETNSESAAAGHEQDLKTAKSDQDQLAAL